MQEPLPGEVDREPTIDDLRREAEEFRQSMKSWNTGE